MKFFFHSNRTKGFTLIEIVVVLVILAVLVAITVPAMTGWIDKAKESELIANCRTCVVAAQTIASEQYVGAGSPISVGGAEVIKLADVPGSVPSISIVSATATVDSLVYCDTSGNSVTYLRLPEPHYEINGNHSFGNVASLETINSAFSPFLQKVTSLSSGAAVQDINRNDIYAGDAVAALKANGIDLNELGAVSWKYFKDGNGLKLEWTSYDLSTLSVGDTVPVIRYRFDGQYNGTYSVWEAKVIAGTSGKSPAISFNDIGGTSKTLQSGTTDYETALKKYNDAVASGKYGTP